MIDLADFPTPAWRRAIRWFKSGDASLVAQLILTDEPMQLQVRKFLADIVTGKQKLGRTDHARKKLNPDHLERLEKYASWIRELGDDHPDIPDIKEIRKSLKSQAISEVAHLSGATETTVGEAWKVINKPWANLVRKRRKLKKEQRELAKAAKELARLRKISAQNNAFFGR